MSEWQPVPGYGSRYSIAPDIARQARAQGMREACEELIWEDEIPVINEQIRKAILARAAEIEGGKEP